MGTAAPHTYHISSSQKETQENITGRHLVASFRCARLRGSASDVSGDPRAVGGAECGAECLSNLLTRAGTNECFRPLLSAPRAQRQECMTHVAQHIRIWHNMLTARPGALQRHLGDLGASGGAVGNTWQLCAASMRRRGKITNLRCAAAAPGFPTRVSSCMCSSWIVRRHKLQRR